jgi:AcrR family transcriptional regulator
LTQPSLSARRTHSSLRAALVDLVEESGFDAVTVTALCDRALVGRATFYRYYTDKFDLAARIFDEALDDLLASVDDEGVSHRQRWRGFLDHVARNDRLYRALLVTSPQQWFAARMQARLAAMADTHLPEDGIFGPGSDKAVAGVVAAVFVQSISWWLAGGRTVPTQVMADGTGRLARAVIAEAGAPGAPGASGR